MREIGGQPEWSSVEPGEAVICAYPSECSACIRLGERKEYPAGSVVLANIVRRENIGRRYAHRDEPYWHGWWSCSGPDTPDHWGRGETGTRYRETGSATK